VPDGSGCCFKQECQCFCYGYGDPHYVTFDGTYYGFQGNCSYVLVKEIKPMYNFSIIIENVYCDTPDDVSCPKSLTIHYKSFEIYMSQDVSPGNVTNLIYVNHKRIYPSYMNGDFKVTNNGIEAFVVIPDIGASIMFSGMQFSVGLPWSKFHGNTEGQCGTCDNNRTDDCLLPNGKIDPSCPDMAHHWKVNASNCPVPPTPTPPPTPCSPETTSICKIIASKVFEKCHGAVSYESYIEACEYDVCHMNISIGCASLQSYAQLCAQNGFCIDWRGATDGVCACNVTTCPRSSCPVGYIQEIEVGACCPKCVPKPVCVNNNTEYSINGIWSPPGDKCVKYECVKVGSSFITMEARTLCPPYNPNDCIPVFSEYKHVSALLLLLPGG
ncbi:intestinal mucin-like protein, partial [Sardina pilchardus]|uniref:intestinal mucin-like protein n=1 Tax=Sardina pilchardus TaxID=27697 RepID=UPI002E0E2B68